MGSTNVRTQKRQRTWLTPGIAGTARGRSIEAPIPSLSPREREVLALIALGMTDRQIADELIVSRVTISTHVAHILDKLGVPNRTAAVAYATRHHLLDSGRG